MSRKKGKNDMIPTGPWESDYIMNISIKRKEQIHNTIIEYLYEKKKKYSHYRKEYHKMKKDR